MPKNSLQAIILAGGFGTRLSPLTTTKPKPLVKILDTTVLENVINCIRRANVGNITVSTHYKPDMVEKECKRIDENIKCVCEKTPLGTAGGVKFCYDGQSENVIVVSGDAIFDFDIAKAVEYHVNNKNEITIVTSHKENPTQLGNVICQNDARVLNFVEKPAWKNVETDLVNTGIYILRSSVIERIPDNMMYDFSQNLFPKLLGEGREIYSFAAEGYWCDVGSFEEYFLCNMMAAEDRINTIPNTGQKPETLIINSVHTENTSYVSILSKLGKNVKITRSVICKNTSICDNCDVVDSVVGQDTFVGKGSSVCGTIVGDNVSIGENCIVPEGCIIGDNARICDGTKLKKYTRVAAHSTVSKENKNTMDFSKHTNVFKDDATAVFDTRDLGFCLSNFGKALVINAKKWENYTPVICVMSDKASEYAKTAFLSGLQMTGARIFDLGVGEMPVSKHVSRLLSCDCSVYLYTSCDRVEVKVLDGDSVCINVSDERKISKIYSSIVDDENDKSLPDSAGEIYVVPALEIYKAHLLKMAGELSQNVYRYTLPVYTETPLVRDVFARLGCEIKTTSSPVSFNLDVQNDLAKIRRTTLVLDHNHICALILKNCEVLPNACFAVADNTPTVIKNLLPKNIEANPKIIIDLSDPYVCLVALASVLVLSADSFEELASKMPVFEIYSDEYLADVNRAATMEKLSRMYSDTKNTDTDGIRLQMADGNVTVVPNRAKGFKIVAEAVNMETAKELSFKIGEIIKG